MKMRIHTTVGVVIKVFSYVRLKKYVEKVHKIGATIQKSKRLSCNKSWFQKAESYHHTINEFIESKNHPSVQFVIKVFHKNMNLRIMLTQFMKMRIHTIVGVVIKVFSYVRFKRHLEKFIRLEQPDKRAKAKTAVRVGFKKLNNISTK